MSIEIPKIIKTKCYSDQRGYLQEVFLKKKYKKDFKFSLVTLSKKNVFRGFHFQQKKQQTKLIYLAKGALLDIVIDLRKKSKNFGKVFKFKLKEKNILYIPKGFAHGYVSLSKESILIYYMNNYRDSKIEDYEKTSFWLENNNFKVLRMGKGASKEISYKSKNIIDYANSNETSDLLDIFLLKNCKFLL